VSTIAPRLRFRAARATALGALYATLARWLGVSGCDLATIFPYPASFAPDPGFTG
jgi:uncharacterized protein (DUF1501 family)